MKEKSRYQVVLILLVVLTISFIWIQSALPVEQSDNESKAVTENVVQPIGETVNSDVNISDELVRKWAHCFEYAVLGALLLLLFQKDRSFRSFARVFSFGIGIALLDETIQIISGRGPEIKDVWIDGLGVVIGMVLAGGLRGIFRAICGK